LRRLCFNRIQELQSTGQTADEALNTALGELETQLGVTRQDLLGTIGETEQSILSQVGTQISGVETSLLNRIQELQSAGQTADEALNTALGELETQLGVTRQDLLGTIGDNRAVYPSTGRHSDFRR
jgi:phosphoenolpyruvate-protein kinase (PTS system EI component)